MPRTGNSIIVGKLGHCPWTVLFLLFSRVSKQSTYSKTLIECIILAKVCLYVCVNYLFTSLHLKTHIYVIFMVFSRVPPNKLPILKRRPQIKCIILAAVCLAVGVTWAVFRNAQYAWILQDVLGVTFCIQLMKTIRLPNLMVSDWALSMWPLSDEVEFLVFCKPNYVRIVQWYTSYCLLYTAYEYHILPQPYCWVL